MPITEQIFMDYAKKSGKSTYDINWDKISQLFPDWDVKKLKSDLTPSYQGSLKITPLEAGGIKFAKEGIKKLGKKVAERIKKNLPYIGGLAESVLPRTPGQITPSLIQEAIVRYRAIEENKGKTLPLMKEPVMAGLKGEVLGSADWLNMASENPIVRKLAFERIKKRAKEEGELPELQKILNIVMVGQGINVLGGKVFPKAGVIPKIEPILSRETLPEIVKPEEIRPPVSLQNVTGQAIKLAKQHKGDLEYANALRQKYVENGKIVDQLKNSDKLDEALEQSAIGQYYLESAEMVEGQPKWAKEMAVLPEKPVAPVGKPAVGEIPPETKLYSGFPLPEYLKKIFETEVKPKIEAEVSITDPIIEEIKIALKESKPLRGKQEALYTKERGEKLAKALGVREKIGGEAGFYAEKGQLKGEMGKVQFEPIGEKIGQDKIDYIFQKVTDTPYLGEWEKIPAREGLVKIFREGKVPTEGELDLLGQVFDRDFIKAILDKRDLWSKVKGGIAEAVNIPRSWMASIDLSFGLRQGAFAAPKFRTEFFNSFKKQFELFGNEKSYQALLDVIKNDPNYQLARQARVSFTEMGSRIMLREEKFASSWAEKVPIIGKGVRASGRAYTGFANKYRLDIFKSLIKDAELIGENPRKNPYLLTQIGDLVNTMTGRGGLKSHPFLNAFFFSPRLMASRLNLLNPVFYIKQPAFIRQQALKSLLGFAGATTTILAGAKMMGADVGLDPRNADFGKIKIGNTRIDPLAGFGQYIRAGAQIISGKYISSITGKALTLGEGYKSLTRLDILARQIESKEAPVASLITTLMQGKDFQGKPISIPKEASNRFVPMVIGDLVDIYKSDPKLIPAGLPAIFGVGMQTYESYPKEVQKFNNIFSQIESSRLDLKEKLDKPAEVSQYLKEHPELNLYSDLNQIDNILIKLNKKRFEIKDNKELSQIEKEKQIAIIDSLRIKLATGGLNYYEQGQLNK